jgi:hypothetical protein
MSDGAGPSSRPGDMPEEATRRVGSSFRTGTQGSECETSNPSDRMRWIADYLDLADKAIAVVAGVQGIDYPSDLHQGAQRDLRRWAHWLEASPVLADGFAVARLDLRADGVMGDPSADRF